MAQPTADAIRAEEKEIWEDVEVLRFLQTHQYGNGLSAFNKDRVYRRAKSYCWMGDNLFRLQSRGPMVVVPRPQERIQLALGAHKALRHFGIECVLDRLQRNYWWWGMVDTAVTVVKSCMSCARVKSGFRESSKELQPLPIRGLGHRWGVDFAGPIEKTATGNARVLVCIEHFTKWVELIPLPSKSSKDSPRALLEGVLNRYEAPEEVLNDQGR